MRFIHEQTCRFRSNRLHERLRKACFNALSIKSIKNRIHTLLLGVLTARHVIYGAPVDLGKSWNYVRQKKWFLLKNFFLTRWTAIQIGAKFVFRKKTKLAGAFLIGANDWILLDKSLIDYYLNQKAHFGLEPEYKLTPLFRTSREELKEFYEKHGLSWSIRHRMMCDEKGEEFYLKEIIRFALHFKAWLHCLESGAPSLIIECGLRLPVSLPELRIKHLAVLGLQDSGQTGVPLRPEVKEQNYPFLYIDSPCCYAVTSRGAEMLIDAARGKLLPPMELFMKGMIKKLDVIYYPLVSQKIDDRIMSEIVHKAYMPLQESFWQRPEDPGR